MFKNSDEFILYTLYTLTITFQMIIFIAILQSLT